jgi:acyl carrier protein
MGLDAVELILRIEEEFSITISDEEAAASVTVGDLFRVVLGKLDVNPGCLSSKAFYVTRRALVDVLGVPRRSIRPSTKLSLLLPDDSRRRQWSKIHQSLGLAMPELRIPGDLKQDIRKRTFFVGSILAVVSLIAGVVLGWHMWLVLPFAIVLWIAAGIASMSLVERLSMPKAATELPADTAGELAQVVLSLNRDFFQPRVACDKQTDEDVWGRLVDIICDQLQVGRDQVVPNARFVDDLDVA